MPSKQVASSLCPGSTTKVGSVRQLVSRSCIPVPAPFPVTITLTPLGHKPNRPPPFCLLSLTSSSPVFPLTALLSRSFPTPEGFILSTFI
ncbi:hypothetical protein ACN42_g9400 [Penicillium freii]|uniref:Uncharacterized protein n=1 Tax=Penicillium freii TaxID=48697 RepID=A0A124GQD4_PENFR|nr:hypothetical protein ACN42_g9400 [Penicillium freii]